MTELPTGYALRPLTPGDIPAGQALLDACESYDSGEATVHEDDLALESRTLRFDFERGAWAIDGPDGRLAGIAWMTLPGERAICTLEQYVRPGLRHLPLDDALLEVGEARAVELALDPARPAFGELPLRLLAPCEAALERRRELLRARGFAVVRETFEMRLDLDGPPPPARFPEGIVVRAARFGQDDRLLYEADEEAFAEHFGHQDRPYDDWRLQTVENETIDPSLWLVAWDGAEVAGQVWAVPRGHDVYVDSLAVRAPWRGGGLGIGLLRELLRLLGERGYAFARLFVDAQNETGALGLYLKAGMFVERRFEVFEKTFDAQPG